MGRRKKEAPPVIRKVLPEFREEPEPVKPLFSPAEVAERWGCSEAAIRARLQNRTLAKADVPGIKISYEEIRNHERMLSFGTEPDELSLLRRLERLEREKESLKRQNQALREWRDRLCNLIVEEV